MNRHHLKVFSAILLSTLFLSFIPGTALAASAAAVVIGNNYTLDSGETLNDNLFVLGGSVDLLAGSTVNGNVVLIGGSVQASGTIIGNVTVLGGTLNLGSTFILKGNLTNAGTAINRNPGAQIFGEVNTIQNAPYFTIPGQVTIPAFNRDLNPFYRVVSFFFRLFLWTLIAMVVAMFFPNQLTHISQTAIQQPLISGGMGLLTVIIVPIVLVLLAITICLIPVSLLGVLVLVIAWAAGLISLGYELGKRIGVMIKQEWHPAILTGLGTLALMLVLSGVEVIVPCVGWIPKALVGLVGLGAVLLTQGGMKPYMPNQNQPRLESGNATPSSK
jgi:hypothetical protein